MTATSHQCCQHQTCGFFGWHSSELCVSYFHLVVGSEAAYAHIPGLHAHLLDPRVRGGYNYSINPIINNVMQCGEGIECKRYTAILHGFNENHSKAFIVAGHNAYHRSLVELSCVLEAIELDALQSHLLSLVFKAGSVRAITYHIETVIGQFSLNHLPNIKDGMESLLLF